MISLLLLGSAVAETAPQCATEDATKEFKAGYAAMKSAQTQKAIGHYKKCLELDGSCMHCHWELGWGYYAASDWDNTIKSWERVLQLDPTHSAASQWLDTAKAQKRGAYNLSPQGVRVPIGIKSKEEGPVHLELIARFQNYNHNPKDPADHHDAEIYSPKSATFSKDGSLVYINSLEGYQTIVYDTDKLEKVHTIDHKFDANNEHVFNGETTVWGYKYNRRAPDGNVNHMRGKPVEATLSHNGRYLWVPYYRRNFDNGSTSPSAVSAIDTTTHEIVRAFQTAPIPKYVAASPDSHWLAVTHWGDNTLGVIDTSDPDPKNWAYRDERLVVNYVLSQDGLIDKNRDAACGYCLRGTTFTPDGSTLLVSRMGGGGVAGFNVADWSYLGTVTGEKPTPRHIVVSKDGEWLYMSQNRSGHISKVPMANVMAGFEKAAGGKDKVTIDGWKQVFVGGGARTIELSPDEKYVFGAAHGRSQVVVLDADTMEVVAKVRTDRWTVGLAVSPDGSQVWTTSQGAKGQGGNSVCVYKVTYDE